MDLELLFLVLPNVPGSSQVPQDCTVEAPGMPNDKFGNKNLSMQKCQESINVKQWAVVEGRPAEGEAPEIIIWLIASWWLVHYLNRFGKSLKRNNVIPETSNARPAKKGLWTLNIPIIELLKHLALEVSAFR